MVVKMIKWKLVDVNSWYAENVPFIDNHAFNSPDAQFKFSRIGMNIVFEEGKFWTPINISVEGFATLAEAQYACQMAFQAYIDQFLEN